MPRVNIKAILEDPELRRKLFIQVIVATQAREGIDTTPEQAATAYDKVLTERRGSATKPERKKRG
jgi:hypothetical protein